MKLMPPIRSIGGGAPRSKQAGDAKLPHEDDAKSI